MAAENQTAAEGIRRRRADLQASRTRAMEELQTACDRRRRVALEQLVEDIDAELRSLEAP